MAMPVGTTTRPPPAAMVASSRARRSAPASPGLAYTGKGSSGSRRTISIGSMAGHGTASAVGGRRVWEPPGMLVWMDLEMTGLDPGRHTIVEIATIVTDDDLAVVAEGPDLVVHQP